MRSLLGRLRRPISRSQLTKSLTLISDGDGSTLSLDFTAMSGLDSRFTFSRASTTSTFINSSGLVATAGTNVARFDHDPTTLAPRGLLIEGAATNLLVYSQFTYTGSNPPTGWTSPFTGGPGSATASAFGSLDDSNAWTQTATANRPMLSSTAIALTSGNTYTASMYLESVSGGLTYQDVLLLNPSSATVGAATYRRNGVVVNAADTAQPGRIEASLSCTGSGNSNLRCGPGANASCTGSATFSRPQVEIGTAASSYIPTGSNTVQRASDSCSMTGTNFSSWFNASEGTVFSHHRANEFTTTTRFVGSLRESDSNYIDVLRYSPSSFYPNNIVQSGGSLVSQLIDSGLTYATARKSAVAFKADDFALSVNGRSVITDTSGAMPTVNPNTLWIGSYAGSLHLNGTIASLKFWPTRLPNATLQSLTQ